MTSNPLDRFKKFVGSDGPGRIGRYELIREIAKGGMGVVYEAVDPDLKRPVALKVVREGEVPPSLITRLHREAAATARLRHPNIVSVHEVGTDDSNGHYISMELIQGETLAQKMSVLMLPDRIRILLAVTRAVEYAHQEGVLHRDIKPANILLERATSAEDQQLKWRVVLSDFGLARIVEGEDLTRTGAIMGTPSYMSPEQVRGQVRETGPATDIWSLGVILYEMLTDRMPFEGKTALEIYDKVVRAEPTPPTKVLASVPQDLETICLKALEGRPENRYSTAGEMAEDLKRYLNDEEIHARRAPVAQRVLRRIRKRPWVYGMAGLATVMAIIALTVGLVLGRELDLVKESRDALLGAERIVSEYEQEIRNPPHDMRPTYDKLDAAIDQLRRALEIQPGAHPVRAKLGDVLRLRERFAEGERELKDAIKLSPDPDYHFRLGRLYEDWYTDRFDGLIYLRESANQALRDNRIRHLKALSTAAFHSALHQLPTDDWRHVYASVWKRIGTQDFAEARKLCRSLLDQKPFHVATLLVLSRIHSLEGQEGPALKQADLAVEAGRSEPRVYLRRGAIRTGLGRARFESGEDGEAMLRGAIEDYTTALEIHPESFRIRMARGTARGILGNQLYDLGKDYSEIFEAAINEDFTQVIETRPTSVRAYTERGILRNSLGYSEMERGRDPTARLEAAVTDFDEALRLDPDHHQSWVGRGNTHINLGLWRSRRGSDPTEFYSMAVEDFKAAVRTDPNDAEAHYGRGNARGGWGNWRLRRGESPEALYLAAMDEDFDAAIRLNPDHARAHNRRGKTRVNYGHYLSKTGKDPGPQYQKAVEEDFKRAVEINPRFADAHMGRATALLNWGVHRMQRGKDPERQYQEAVDSFAEAVRFNPRLVAAHVNRGLTRSNWGVWLAHKGRDPTDQYRKAIEEDFSAAFRHNPKSVSALLKRGNARVSWADYRYNRGKESNSLYREAIEKDYSPAIHLNPGLAEAYMSRGRAWLRLGQKKEAAADFSRGLQINSNYLRDPTWRADIDKARKP